MNILERLSCGFMVFFKKSNFLKLDVQASRNTKAKLNLSQVKDARRPEFITISYQKQPPEVFYKKGIYENFAIFTGKHLFGVSFNKVTYL